MNDTLDRWVQRALVACMVALAAGLLGMGLVLYAPRPTAQWTSAR